MLGPAVLVLLLVVAQGWVAQGGSLPIVADYVTV
jgi:hypothetical protein